MKQFVLIRVIEVPEDRKWLVGTVCSGGPVVGLHELDSGLCGTTVKQFNSPPSVGIGWMIPEGKGQNCVIGSSKRRVFMDGDGPGHVIESASQVMNEVGVDQRPSSDLGRRFDLDEGAIAGMVLIGLRNESIWLRGVPSIDLSIESIEQFFGAA